MNGRIYDPLLGRFLSADLVVQNAANLQAFNRYSYVLNNPLSLTDPSGWEYAPPMFVQTMQAAFVAGHGQAYMDAQAKCAKAGAEAVCLAGIGFIPVAGDLVGLKMDFDDLTSPTTAWWVKGLAGLDVGLTLLTGGLAPNIGPERRAAGVIADEVKTLEKDTKLAAEAAAHETKQAANAASGAGNPVHEVTEAPVPERVEVSSTPPKQEQPKWKQYEEKHGGQQTTMQTEVNGEVKTVRLDKPPEGGVITDFKDYDWSNASYDRDFIRDRVTEKFTEQIGKYKTIESNVNFQFSAEPPAWVKQIFENAGASYSVKP